MKYGFEVKHSELENRCTVTVSLTMLNKQNYSKCFSASIS